jgi:hypothetical protein
MAEITGSTESWNGHTFSEVETYIKNTIYTKTEIDDMIGDIESILATI